MQYSDVQVCSSKVHPHATWNLFLRPPTTAVFRSSCSRYHHSTSQKSIHRLCHSSYDLSTPTHIHSRSRWQKQLAFLLLLCNQFPSQPDDTHLSHSKPVIWQPICARTWRKLEKLQIWRGLCAQPRAWDGHWLHSSSSVQLSLCRALHGAYVSHFVKKNHSPKSSMMIKCEWCEIKMIFSLGLPLVTSQKNLYLQGL